MIMLEELKNLKYRGGKEGLLFFLQKVIGNTPKTEKDIKIICSHGFEGRFFSSDELIQYCHAFNWIGHCNYLYSIPPEIGNKLDNTDNLNDYLIQISVDCLFDNSVFTPSMFSYDSILELYYLKNEMLGLSYSTIRNVLASQGFLVISRNNQNVRFYINPQYESLIAKHCKEKERQITLKQLEEKLKRNKDAGEKAELFVLEYEKARLGSPLDSKIKRISEIDVSAGYDIVSFQTKTSCVPDCFIEVKAISEDYGFYWSKNEYEIAKLKGNTYFLYLVKLSEICRSDYIPTIIQDPAKNIMNSDSWFAESQSFYIKKIK